MKNKKNINTRTKRKTRTKNKKIKIRKSNKKVNSIYDGGAAFVKVLILILIKYLFNSSISYINFGIFITLPPFLYKL